MSLLIKIYLEGFNRIKIMQGEEAKYLDQAGLYFLVCFDGKLYFIVKYIKS